MIATILAASDVPAAPVVALMGIGALIAIGGHIARSRRTAALGIAILFAATLLMMVGAYIAFEDDAADPRPRGQPGGF
ncbi:MAG: benzoate transporter [Solirubrobacterales bacterium]|nr:benzoate transporter [Solirubrobacterales bacterium]